MVSCSIAYPKFQASEFQKTLHALNDRYRLIAEESNRRCREELYRSALEQYRISQKEGYPFSPYELMRVFTVTYNAGCTLSLYFDEYQYTGGAHGLTVRTSDTWNLETGNPYALYDFFPEHYDYRSYILTQVDAEIARQTDAGHDIFFYNASALARDTFNEDSFYLTNKGIVVYFQQYDIAPYSSGIMEFLIPYGDPVPARPACRAGS